MLSPSEEPLASPGGGGGGVSHERHVQWPIQQQYHM